MLATYYFPPPISSRVKANGHLTSLLFPSPASAEFLLRVGEILALDSEKLGVYPLRRLGFLEWNDWVP